MSEIEKQIVLLREQLEKVENKKFMNQMVDHWGDVNYSIDRECFNEITKLKAQIKELEDGIRDNG